MYQTRKNKLFFSIVWKQTLFCCFFIALSKGNAAPVDTLQPDKLPTHELLFHQQAYIPLSHYRHLEMTIYDDGHGSAFIISRQTYKLTFHLIPDDLATLKSLVEITDFFDAPLHEDGVGPDMSPFKLRITLNGQHRELEAENRRDLDPLMWFLYGIYGSGELLADSIKKLHPLQPNDAFIDVGDIRHSSLRQNIPGMADTAEVIRALRDLIHASNDNNQLFNAIETLAKFAPPEEWIAILGADLKSSSPAHAAQLLNILSAEGGTRQSYQFNLPRSDQVYYHYLTLLLIYQLNHFNRQSSVTPKAPQADAPVYIDANIPKFLGYIRYVNAIPVLTALLHNEKMGEASAEALARMGDPAIEPLKASLQDKHPTIRYQVIRALGQLADIQPDTDWPGRNLYATHFGREMMTTEQVESLRKTLKTEVVPKLQAIVNQDIDGQVQTAAQEAIDKITGNNSPN